MTSELSALEAENDARYAHFVEWSESELAIFHASVQDAVADIGQWTAARLDWIAGLADPYYRGHLESEVTERRTAALLALTNIDTAA